MKAEVDDNGRVTTLKYMAAAPPKAPRATGLGAETGQLALAREEDRPAQVDMTGGSGYPPKEYAVVPLRSGQLESAHDTDLIQRPIYDLQGHRVGLLDNLLVDRGTGHIEYAVILVEHTEHHLHPLPWSAIQLQRDPKSGTKMIVDTQKHKIHPDISIQDVKDLSPAIHQIVETMNALRQREAKMAKKRPVDPTVAGMMGEETVGGPGPSGTAGPPPGPAPGFEQEKLRP